MYLQPEIPSNFLVPTPVNYKIAKGTPKIITPLDEVDTVNFFAIGISLERAMFPTYRPGQKEKPICASRDGITPSQILS